LWEFYSQRAVENDDFFDRVEYIFYDINKGFSGIEERVNFGRGFGFQVDLSSRY